MMKLTEEIFETQDFVNQFLNSTQTEIKIEIEDFVEKKLKKYILVLSQQTALPKRPKIWGLKLSVNFLEKSSG